ncbi:MAG: hypothetical protein LBV70_06365, partial [Candidatus Adiutrix sp.]|nr:hypothetical protein [Candidatus Adiutrix sp.]
MSEIAIQAPVVTGPPEIQPAGGQALPQGQPPVLQPPPLRTPQEVLAESRQRFPQADERVLRGEMGIPGPTNRQLDLLEGLSRHPLEGLAPVFIGQGRDFKAALMPTAGVPGPNPGLTIQLYVKEGEALYKRIMNGDEAVPHGKDEVAKVMWFLQALGSAKASESSGRRPPAPALFKAGAFSLEDPGRRLERFLTAANSYERKSSHLDAFQGHPGCQPRGVDIRGVPMPHERQTVLFARMPGANEVHNTAAPNMGPKGMLFLKMEEHGCRGLSLKGTGRAGEGPPSGLKKASRFFANIRDWLGHAFNFIGSLRRRNGLEGQDNRERIPGGVKTLYADLQNGAKALGQGFENLLNRDDPLSKTGGLRVMIRNLEDLRAQFQARPELRAQEPFAAFGPRLDDAVTLLRNRGDHPELRIGNEIILTSEEMKVGQPVPLLRPSQPFTQEGTIDPQTREVLLAGYRYALANIDQREDIEQFEKDANRDTYRVGPSGA